MANSYTWEIGFNWQSRTIRDTDRYPLQHGLVTAAGAPAWPTQLCEGDSFELVLYDTTPVMGGTGPAAPSFTKFELEVTDSNTKSAANVFGLGAGQLPPTGTYDAQSGRLTCTAGAWVGGLSHQSPVFSANNGVLLPRWLISPSFTFEFQAGTFGDAIDISVLLEVDSGTSKKKFVFDPQMKVGPGT